MKVMRSDSCVLNQNEVAYSNDPRILNRVECSSFDADLMLILGKDSAHIGKGDIIKDKNGNILTQPYLDTSYTEPSSHFSKSKYDIYLVSRLDAYTEGEVYSMIDSSGPNTLVNKDSALFVLDAEDTLFGVAINNSQPSYYALDLFEKRADSILVARGWNVLYDTTTNFLTGQRNVLGYVSWGSDAKHGSAKKGKIKPVDNWYKASYAEMFTSYTARSFAYPPFYPAKDSGGSLISDLILQGATGASGPVWEPYTFGFSDVSIFFDRYTDTTQPIHFNLAESHFMANPTMSWMMLLIGDPKTSIVTHLPARPKPAITKNTSICQYDTITLTSSNNLTGNYNWFNGDSTLLKASGQAYDSTNPQWLGSGKSFTFPIKNSKGYYTNNTFTYVNENIAGAGFAQVNVTVILAPKAAFSLLGNGCGTILKVDTLGGGPPYGPGGLKPQWNLNGSPIKGADSGYYTVPTSCLYSLTVTNDSGCSATSAPQNASAGSGSISAKITASGPTSFCQGDSVILIASTGPGYIYQWLRNDTNITGQTTDSLTVKSSGSYTVKISNSGGCSNTSVATKVTVSQSTPIPTITRNGNILTSSSPTGNEWYLNGNFILGATSQNLTVSKGGTYMVKVVGGCSTVSSAPYVYAGISPALRSVFNVNIYPNPSNGSFTINASFANSLQTTLSVKDVLGRNVFVKNYGSVLSISDQINLANSGAGIYFLTLTNGKDAVVKKIMVK